MWCHLTSVIQENYKRYKALSKEELQLPAPNQDVYIAPTPKTHLHSNVVSQEDGDVVIETGELFCRISGCSDSVGDTIPSYLGIHPASNINQRLFRQPYLLRKHVQRGHPEVTLARAPVGKPTERSLKQAKGKFPPLPDRLRLRSPSQPSTVVW